MFKQSYCYHVGRLLFSFACVYMGVHMFQNGHEFYGPYMHALRKTLLPDTKNKIEGSSLTFEDCNKYVSMAMSVLLILGGLLTALNQRLSGPALVIASVLMMIATQDNPWIRDQIKPKPKSANIRMNDLFRHISLIGACLYLMVTPPMEDEEEECDKVKQE